MIETILRKIRRRRSISLILIEIYASLLLICLCFAAAILTHFNKFDNIYTALLRFQLVLSFIGALFLIYSYKYDEMTLKKQIPIAISFILVGLLFTIIGQIIHHIIFFPIVFVVIFIWSFTLIDFVFKHRFSKSVFIVAIVLFVCFAVFSLSYTYNTLYSYIFFFEEIDISDIAGYPIVLDIYVLLLVILDLLFFAWFMVFYSFVYKDYMLNNTSDIVLLENMLNYIKLQFKNSEITYEKYLEKKASILSRLK